MFQAANEQKTGVYPVSLYFEGSDECSVVVGVMPALGQELVLVQGAVRAMGQIRKKAQGKGTSKGDSTDSQPVS